MNKIAYLYVSLTILLWSSVAAIGKLLLTNLDNLQVMFYVLLTATLAILLIAIFQKKLHLLKNYTKKDYWKFTYMGFIGIFLYNALFFAALRYSPAQEAFIVNYTWPIWIIIFATILLKEKLTWQKIIAILLSFIGVYLVITKGQLIGITNLKGNLLAATAAISYGLFSVLGKKHNYDRVISMLLYHTVGLIFATIVTITFSSIPKLTSFEFLGLLWIGAITTGIGFILWFLALKHGDTAKMSNMIFLTPFASLIWIYFLAGEKILISSLIGLLFIVAGIIIQTKRKKKL